MQIYKSPKVCIIQYTTQIWERIAFKKPIKDFILNGLLLPAWIAFGGEEGAVVRANVKTILEGVLIGF